MFFINKIQLQANNPLSFTMNKELLKLIPKIAADPFYSNDQNWYRVSFIFKHTNSRKRFVPSFKKFSATKILKIRSGMNGGDQFTLKKIILSKSDRSHFVVWENEIPDVSQFDFNLLEGGEQPDLLSPVLSSITSPSAGQYTSGDLLNFYLNFNETVLVTGQPKLYLDVGFDYKEATYISGSNSQSLLFRYIVGNIENDNEGIQLDSFNLNGGTIKDAAGNNASINISSFSLNPITIYNDVTGPVIQNISSLEGAFYTDDMILITVNFSEPVTVVGNPSMVLNFENQQKTAEFIYSSNSSVFFQYQVKSSDFSQNNFTIDSLNLNGSTIKDASSNDANIQFSTVTVNSQVNPDITAPTLDEVTVLGNSPFFEGNNIQFQAHFSENVSYTGNPRLVLSINSQTKYANISQLSGSDILIFEYTVTANDIGAVVIQSVDLNGGVIKDSYNNNAVLSFDSITTSVQVNPDITAPTVLNVTGTEGDYITGDSIEFEVQFSENIQVSGTGQESLVLTLDTGIVKAYLASVSGSTAFFSYTATEADRETQNLTISSIDLGSNGFIKDLANNSANLNFVETSKAITINENNEPQFLRLGAVGLFSNTVNSIAQQSDGKLIVSGSFTGYNGALTSRLARLNTDGLLDTTFNVGTGPSSAVSSIVQQSDGKLVIGGGFITYDGVGRNRIARLNTNGSLDTTFSVGAGFNNPVNSIVQQSDGKLVVGGNFATYNGTSANGIARLNTDGSLDTTFNIGTGFLTRAINSIVQQSDGKFIVGGDFTSYNGTSINRIIRLNTDGSLDTTFSVGTGFSGIVNSIILQSDGKLVVGGNFTSYNGTSRSRLARLNTNGSLDTTFSVGTGFDNIPYSIVQQSDGKLVIGGNFTTYNGSTRNRIIRLNTNGSSDSTFSTGTGFGSTVNSIVQQSDGKIIAGGSFTTFNSTNRNRIARLNTDGSLDVNIFQNNSGFNNTVKFVIQQSDKKLIVGGDFTSYGGTSINRIARLNTNGSLDTTFSVGTGFNNTVNSIVQQSDGKLVVGGNFTSYNGSTRNRIIRLNTDGSLDTTFSVGTGFDVVIYSVAQQSDGKVIVGGDFSAYSGTTIYKLARLNTNGSLDTTFNTGTMYTAFNSSIRSIIQQSDGKLIVGGDFTSYSGASRNHIARLNTDGSLDTTFSVGTGFNGPVNSIVQQSDGKLIVGGDFTTFNSTNRNRIARLNTNGSLDTTFSVGTGFSDTLAVVNFVAQQSDGKIVAGGDFTIFNGTSINRIARLNTNGSLDTTFSVGTGSNGVVNSIIIQSNGKIVISGSFTTYNGINFDRIIRLESNSNLEII